MYKEGITIDEMLKAKLETIKNEPDIKKKTLYDVEELIWWKGSEPMLVYLFDLLNASGLIDQTQFDNRFALMAKHFKNKFGKRFDNKQLARVYDRMREDGVYKKPKTTAAEEIEKVVKEIRNKTDELM